MLAAEASVIAFSGLFRAHWHALALKGDAPVAGLAGADAQHRDRLSRPICEIGGERVFGH